MFSVRRLCVNIVSELRKSPEHAIKTIAYGGDDKERASCKRVEGGD